MFIDANSIEFKRGNSYISLGPYILEAKYSYNKLWANDSGRNLKGEMTGTLVGIFPKITVQFRKLNKADLEYLAPLLDSGSQTIRYYDPVKKAKVTMSTYTGDWELTDKNIINSYRKNEGFSISFIARKKRT